MAFYYILEIVKKETEIEIRERELLQKEVELEQAKFGQTQSKKVAQERLREIKTWEEIIW